MLIPSHHTAELDLAQTDRRYMSELIEREKAVVQPDHETIRMLAYDFWCSRGCLEGSPEIDWFAAEKQLTGESPTSPNRHR